MRPPADMTAVIGGKRYSTATATLIAGDDWWDGNNFERRGRNTFLYRTPKGAFFLVHLTQWQGERDRIEPIEPDRALDLWDNLATHRVDVEEAFPPGMIEDA